jgi:hypothetical protein
MNRHEDLMHTVHPNQGRREGMALATALVAIVLIGALIAATFFTSTQEYRVGRNSLSTERALAAAEYGQNRLLTDWSLIWNQNMKVGDTITRVYTTGGGAADTVVATRVRFNMFWVVSTGRTSGGANSESRRRTGLLVRLNTPYMPFPGAVSTANKTLFTGNASTSGNDTIPAGWSDCPPAPGPVAAAVSPNLANITFPVATSHPCYNGNCLAGDPKTAASPDAGDSTKILDGFNELASRADKVFDQLTWPVIDQVKPLYKADGSCDETQAKNWGDPWRANPAGKCENVYPIIHLKSTIKGSLGPLTKLNQGRGQGILLVDGNVQFAGTFEWFGPVVVRGNVTTSGVGNKVIGGIEALNQGCVPGTGVCNTITGTSNITYSSCAINKALAHKTYPTIANGHAWADMF